MSLEFLLVSLVVVASPGTGVVYTLAAGLAHGGRATPLRARTLPGDTAIVKVWKVS